MIRKARVKECTEVPVHQRRRGNMKSGHFALGLLLFASVAAAQQYVISTYAGGGPSAVAAPGLSVGIGGGRGSRDGHGWKPVSRKPNSPLGV